MKNQKKPVLLMTATVDPQGMISTVLQDPNIRKRQYLDAIDYYLKSTDYNIVFCENTEKNLFDEIESSEKYKRLEYLTFRGNDYDKGRGKGYGEVRIIQYAIQNSQFLKKADYLIKITGRVKILNLEEISKNIEKKDNSNMYVVVELIRKDIAKSVCFLSPTKWLLDTCDKYGERDDYFLLDFEKMLYRSISETRNMKIYPFYQVIDGICGTYGTPYSNFNSFHRRMLHYYSLCDIYKSRGERKNYLISKIYGLTSQWLFFICRAQNWLYRKITAKS